MYKLKVEIRYVFNSLVIKLELGITELLVIFLFIVLIFGPDKLPEIARKLGKYYSQLMKYKEYLDEEIRKGMLEADLEEKRSTKRKYVEKEETEGEEAVEEEPKVDEESSREGVESNG